MEPLEGLWPITLLKMDAESISSGYFPSKTESNFGVFPPKPGDVDCRFFANFRLPLRPQGGEVATIKIMTFYGSWLTLTALKTSTGVIMLTPVLLTRRRVLLTLALSHAASATTSFVSGVKSV